MCVCEACLFLKKYEPIEGDLGPRYLSNVLLVAFLQTHMGSGWLSIAFIQFLPVQMIQVHEISIQIFL